MEIKKFNVNLHSENNTGSNNLTMKINHIIELKNKSSMPSINMSLLTTKTDDAFDKITVSDKKINSNSNSNQNSHLEDDSILESLKSKGLLNKTLEIKFEEYKKHLKQTLIQDKNLTKIALINEIKSVNKNIQIAIIEQENLLHLKELKDKKIDILDNSVISINHKIKYINDKIDSQTKNDDNKGNENSVKKKNINKNWKNILIQHYEIFSYDLLKNISINEEEEKDPEKLEKDLSNLRINNEIQIMNLKEHLKIKNIIAANNKKLQFEKEIKQMNNDHVFLENNLSLEREAFIRKLNKYKELINRPNNRTDNQSFYNNDNGVTLENNTYIQRKTAYIEKINYLKNMIKNSNVNLLTSNNSIITRRGDHENFNNDLFTKTNESLEDCGIKLDGLNTIIFENNDFLQINSANQNNKFLIKKQPHYKKLSLEIGLSNINSP